MIVFIDQSSYNRNLLAVYLSEDDFSGIEETFDGT